MEEERKEVIAYCDISGSRKSPNCISNNKSGNQFYRNGEEIILSATPGQSDIEVVKQE